MEQVFDVQAVSLAGGRIVVFDLDDAFQLTFVFPAVFDLGPGNQDFAVVAQTDSEHHVSREYGQDFSSQWIGCALLDCQRNTRFSRSVATYTTSSDMGNPLYG